MKSMMFLLLVLLMSCGIGEVPVRKKDADADRIIAMLADTSVSGDMVPLADGSAYVCSFSSGLWYVQGSTAVRVMTTDGDTVANPVHVYPRPGKGAYLRTFKSPEYWLLDGAVASPLLQVTDVAMLDTLH